MKKSFRFNLMSIALIGAYILSACGGTLPQSASNENGAPKVLASEIVFTGIVEQISGNQWVVSGQTFTVDPAARMDSGIAVGDIVKVEGTVSADGSVVALTIETSSITDDNSNTGNANDDNSNGTAANSNDDNSNGASGNSNDDNSNTAGGADDEVFGQVEAMTADSITVGGVMYQLTGFTEFKDAIAVGDQVKIHVMVNADGTFAIREIEKSDGLSGDDNGNGANSNDSNGNDDNSNDDNGNDDNGNGGDDNDNDGDDDNGNDD
jgi:hypothetical protein